MVTRTAALAALACGALAGCSLFTDSFRTNDFSGDPFPIYIARDSGAVLIGVREPDGREHVAVLDVLSPVTITDSGIDELPSLVTSDLTLLGRSSSAGEAFDIARARLRAAEVISLHPCPNDPEQPLCSVGPTGAQPYSAIVGANALAGDALRLRLGEDQVFVLADVGGEERDRTFVCDAVFPAPYRGGGTLLIAGTEVPFGGRRVTLQACLGADPDPAPIMTSPPDVQILPLPQSARGGDALLVVSTGIGISLLSEPAYERYRQARLKQAELMRKSAPPTPPPPLEALPEASAFLPSGQVFGRRASIDRLALAAVSSSASRAPCRQAYAHHLLLQPNTQGASPLHRCTTTDDCPCSDGDTFCAVPAVVELEPPGGLEVLVVPDDNATLQALRAELRPDQPEVDGILGADALALAEIDVDYPHNRVLMRCPAASPAVPPARPACTARPAFAEIADLDHVGGCIGPPAP
jgi:hypothetical protein